MKLIVRDELKINPLPGRGVQLVVGAVNAASASNSMTWGFAHYDASYGPMAPHRHAEEVVFVLEADRSYVRYGGFGERPDELGERVPLAKDMIMHFSENEWHVFEYEEGGHMVITFSYPNPGVYTGQVKG